MPNSLTLKDGAVLDVSKPSRELDALVAEKVMGWKWITPNLKCDESNRHRWLIEKSRTFHRLADQKLPVDWRLIDWYVPWYSFNPNDAFMVVDSLAAKGFWLSVKSPFEAHDLVWRAGFTPHSTTGWNGRPDHCGEGDTPALAICLAAVAVTEAKGGAE
jgi:hypothetical protein